MPGKLTKGYWGFESYAFQSKGASLMALSIIRLNDKTTHGGVVIEGVNNFV